MGPRFALLASLVAFLSVLPTSTFAAPYTTGFEDFATGPISPTITTAQNGWSGGAQGGFTNNDAGDEQIAGYAAHSGALGWHYARGYNSPGQGTPYTPNVIPGVLNDGDTFHASLWFKAAVGGDGSLLAIETGNAAGDDRAEIIAYIDNVAGGLTIRSFTGSTFAPVPLYSGVDASVWHLLEFTMTKDGFQGEISIALDGGSPIVFDGSLNAWRESLSLTYADSSRFKFRTRHADGDPQFSGFYLDDISYFVTAAATDEVPEPASLAVWGLVSMAGAAYGWRKRRSLKCNS